MSDVVESLLAALEAELKQLQYWSVLPPSANAMASNLPFCYDTMTLQQWLQYVFIPRMRALLESAHPLPNKIAISPIAEQAFNPADNRVVPLLTIIAKLDQTLCGAI